VQSSGDIEGDSVQDDDQLVRLDRERWVGSYANLREVRSATLAKLGIQRGYILRTHSPLTRQSIPTAIKNARIYFSVAESQEKKRVTPSEPKMNRNKQIGTHPLLTIANCPPEGQKQNREIAVI
jgi:protein tyrosine/serine phosphatase